MVRAIVDCDPGVDDALALILALRSPELEIAGITTVAGNVGVELTTVNALRVVELLEMKVPVAKGMSKPLLRERSTAEGIHGSDGQGNANFPLPMAERHTGHASELILDTVKSSKKDEVAIIATGPLSNIAVCILKDPDTMKNVRRIFSMGGAFGLTPYGFGNCTPVAEFNIFADPEAAKITYTFEVPVTAVGLDVTTNPASSLRKTRFPEIQHANTKTSNFVVSILSNWMQRFNLVSLHDPMAVAVALDPSLAKTNRASVDIEVSGSLTTGQTVVDRRLSSTLKKMVDICVEMDGQKFVNLFLDRVVFK